LNEKLFKDGIINEDGSLTILNASESHRGHFKCVAENEVGSDERIIILTVHTAPTIEGSGQEIRFPSDGSIQIVTPQMNHAGKYTCHVSNLAGDDHITYLLKIQEPPLIISDIPDAIDVIHGMMLEIPCRAVGTPDPTVTWEKDGFPIISDEVMGIDASGTLHIDVAQSFHQGEYQCVASNPAGKDQRRTVISVQEPPVISPTTLSDYTTVEGDRIEMRCLANANPPPVITWSRKGIPVSEDMVGIHVTEDSEQKILCGSSLHQHAGELNYEPKIISDGTLVIENVVNDDAGHYTCKASNAAGDADKVIRLSVIIPPDIPDQDTIASEAVVVGQPFSLYCPVFSTPLPQISWHLDDHPVADGDPNIQLSDDKRHLHVLRSRPTDTGNYKCVARNPAGESSKSFQVEILGNFF
uniref:Ig-like domain-containing protein n=1 Tax=Anisakis simplex TaxID=6269 RepID=A0A0M3KE33_ANISI